MHFHQTAQPRPNQSGVIDSLADGLSLAIARPWLLIVPVLLDLYYWVGWSVSVESLLIPIKNWVIRQDQAESGEVASSLVSLSQADATQLLALLSPSLLAGATPNDMYVFAERSQVTPEHWAIAFVFVVAFLTSACLLHAVYAVPLADAAIDRQRSRRLTVKAMMRAWLRIVGLHLAVFAIGALLLGPALIAAIALILVGVDPTPLISFAALVLVAAGFMIWWFALKAIVVGDVGPLHAMRAAFTVVRNSLWQSIGFVGAWLLLTVGLGQVWLEIIESPPGLLIGVIANAFFAGGATMAGMIFLQSRMHAKPSSSKPARSSSSPRATRGQS